MNKLQIHENHFAQVILEQRPLIDVRAPIEFNKGSLPNSVNIPILNDEERALVGTCYKKNGNAAAVELGHQIVSGSNKLLKIAAWQNFIQQYPNAIIYCFRGGMRSQITQQWLSENNLSVPIIAGGYKKVRQFLIEYLNQASQVLNFKNITGPTGSGKTQLIWEVRKYVAALDLEALARHRGSAFGGMNQAQPAQIDFENQIAVELMKISQNFSPSPDILIEDESRLIGRCAIPMALYNKYRQAPVIWLDESIENRINNIFADYITAAFLDNHKMLTEDNQNSVQIFEKFKKSVISITRKLGHDRSKEIINNINDSQFDFSKNRSLESNKIWIRKILEYYYDPIYLTNLNTRQPKIIYKGNFESCKLYLLTNSK